MSKTKQAVCIDCNKDITVSIFASLAKARCDKCKGGANGRKTIASTNETGDNVLHEMEHIVVSDDPIEVQQNDGRMSIESIKRGIGKTEREKRVDAVPNQALRSLCCPHHPSQTMQITGLVRSDTWGDNMVFQCPQCYTIVQISEQSTFPARVYMDALGELTSDAKTELLLGALKDGKSAETLYEVEGLKWVK